MSARVQSEPFDAEEILRGFGPGAGALVTFTGIVRDDGGKLDALEIEHYPAMTQSALMAYGQQAAERFELLDWCIVHRYRASESRRADHDGRHCRASPQGGLSGGRIPDGLA